VYQKRRKKKKKEEEETKISTDFSNLTFQKKKKTKKEQNQKKIYISQSVFFFLIKTNFVYIRGISASWFYVFF